MGEEFAASTPFLFFCDFGPELAEAVRDGRREEFARFARFRDPQRGRRFRTRTPRRPSRASKLDWSEAEQAIGSQWRDFYRNCLALRRRHLVPWLAELRSGGSFHVEGETLLRLAWTARNGQRLHLIANLASAPCTDVALPAGELVFATDGVPAPGTTGEVPRHGAAFILGRNA